MAGLFERELGTEWEQLHPQIRDRYGLEAAQERQAVGRGTMSRLERHPLVAPMLWLCSLDDLLVPVAGTDMSFTITTTAFVDDAGYEALFLDRQFQTDPPTTFVDTLRWNPKRGCLTDLLGRHGLVAVDVSLSVVDNILDLTLGRQWLRIGQRYVSLPEQLSVSGTLRDWYDDDAEQFGVAADVSSPLLDTVFGYQGQFQNSFRPLSDAQHVHRPHTDTPLPGAA
jgi:hypothetical protein